MALELTERLGDTLRRFHEEAELFWGFAMDSRYFCRPDCLRQIVTLANKLPLLHGILSGDSLIAGCNCKPPRAIVFLHGLDHFELPVAHAEGRFTIADETYLQQLKIRGQLVLHYATNKGGQQSNPNGSEQNIAGVCDPTGRIFGLMPHPERFIDATQHLPGGPT